MKANPAGLSRRQILEAGVATVVTLAAALWGRGADAQQKVSKAMIHYQERPKDGQECAGCANFVPPEACKVVAGRISRHGWCELWVPRG
jgi:hypothetical protein